MANYRDDREALRQRLTELEEELARVRDTSTQEDMRKEVAVLSARIAEATSKLDSEREGLAEVGARIDALRIKLGGPAETPAETAAETAAEAAAAPQPQSRNVALIGGIAVVLVLFVLIIGTASTRDHETVALPAPLPGAPHAVDPMALLAKARNHAGSSHPDLHSIEVRYVKSDGRVDLEGEGYSGSIVYVFVSPPEPEPAPDPSRPVGAPAPSKPMATQVTVRVVRKGMSADPFYFPGGGERIPDPKCSIVDVWKAAIGSGVPKDAVAIVKYEEQTMLSVSPEGRLERRSGPMWRFSIDGTSHDLYIDDATCSVIPTR